MNQKQIKERLASFGIRYLRTMKFNLVRSMASTLTPLSKDHPERAGKRVSAQVFQFPKGESVVYGEKAFGSYVHHIVQLKGRNKYQMFSASNGLFNHEIYLTVNDVNLYLYTRLFEDAIIEIRKEVKRDDAEASVSYRITSADPTVEKMVFDICQGNGNAGVLLDYLRERYASFVLV